MSKSAGPKRNTALPKTPVKHVAGTSKVATKGSKKK